VRVAIQRLLARLSILATCRFSCRPVLVSDLSCRLCSVSLDSAWPDPADAPAAAALPVGVAVVEPGVALRTAERAPYSAACFAAGLAAAAGA